MWNVPIGLRLTYLSAVFRQRLALFRKPISGMLFLGFSGLYINLPPLYSFSLFSMKIVVVVSELSELIVITERITCKRNVYIYTYCYSRVNHCQIYVLSFVYKIFSNCGSISNKALVLSIEGLIVILNWFSQLLVTKEMAKNTSSSAFRKIDIDQYSEDNFKEDETDSGLSVGPDENEVNSLLQKGKTGDALKVLLKNAPIGIKNPQIKENALNLTLKVLLAIKPSQIEEMVNSLDIDLLDTLMKYVYKGFENPSEGSSMHLLLWHEKIYNVGGVGCIIRVLSDTRRV